jgi:hypothetical protein
MASAWRSAEEGELEEDVDTLVEEQEVPKYDPKQHLIAVDNGIGQG